MREWVFEQPAPPWVRKPTKRELKRKDSPWRRFPFDLDADPATVTVVDHGGRYWCVISGGEDVDRP